VLALLVYFHAQRQQWPLAHQAIEGMRARRIAVEPFVDAPLVVAVYQNVGLDAYAAGALGGAKNCPVAAKNHHELAVVTRVIISRNDLGAKLGGLRPQARIIISDDDGRQSPQLPPAPCWRRGQE
jgi:hypothetical protein